MRACLLLLLLASQAAAFTLMARRTTLPSTLSRRTIAMQLDSDTNEAADAGSAEPSEAVTAPSTPAAEPEPVAVPPKPPINPVLGIAGILVSILLVGVSMNFLLSPASPFAQ